MSAPVTTDPMDLGTIKAALGTGALVLGGSPDTGWGQSVSSDSVLGLMMGGAPSLATGITDVASALESVATFLLTLPLEVLQGMQRVIPNADQSLFGDVETAVATIMQAIGTPALATLDMLNGFIQLITTALSGGDIPGELTSLLTHLPLVGGMFQGFKDITGLLGNPTGLGTGTPTLPGLGSIPLLQGLMSGDLLNGNLVPGLGDLSAEVRQIFEVVQGLLVTPVSTGVQFFKDWFSGLTGKTTNLTSAGELDISKVTDLGNGLLPANLVSGVQGLTDLVETLQHTYDGLASGFTNGDAVSGVGLPDLFHLAQQTAQNALTAIGFTVDTKHVLDNRTNQPVSVGLDPTAEATFDLASLPHGTTLPTTSVAPGASITGYIRHGKAATKGFVKFLGAGTSLSNIFVNVFKVDPSTAARTKLWSSGDISSLIPTGSTLAPVKALIPSGSQMGVAASDLTALEIVNAGSGTLSVGMKTVPVPNDPTVIPQNFGATRSTASTGGATPATLTDSQLTHSGTTPYIAFGITSVPADYQLPVDQQFNTGAVKTGGDFVFNLPSWIKVGDKVDGTALGGGGGGSDSLFAATGNGGYAGQWADATWTYGTEIPVGTTQLMVHAGAGGDHGGYGGAPSGAATTIRLPNGTVLLSAPGGAGGTSGNSNGGNGQGAGIHDYNGKSRFAGGNVGNGANGSKPGGGGGGGFSYLSGGPAADGAAWLTARQA